MVGAIVMIVVAMSLMMSGKAYAPAVLILVPTLFGLCVESPAALGMMMTDGIRQLSPTAVLLTFAILYFSLMIDAGLFAPLVAWMVRRVGHDPVRVVVGSAALGLVVSLDGDGATTYIICISAMLPLYQQLRMNPLILGCVLLLAVGLSHLLPWSGGTARAASGLHLDAAAVFLPFVPAMLVNAVAVLGIAYMLGRSERQRLGATMDFSLANCRDKAIDGASLPSVDTDGKLPSLFLFNLGLTIVLITLLLTGAFPIALLFMIGSGIALVVNRRTLDQQRASIGAHAPVIARVVIIVFAAGIFVGILNGTGMSDHLANAITGVMPQEAGAYLAPITGLFSIPLTLAIDTDPFYFAIMPVLAKTAAQFGVSPASMARASLISQPTHVLIPTAASTHLLASLIGVEYGQLVRFTFKWALLSSLTLLAAGMLLGAIPFHVVS